MAIFSNPLFATYSVYARNASICQMSLLANFLSPTARDTDKFKIFSEPLGYPS